MVQSVAMLKTEAIQLLGGTTASAAEAIGISYQAVDKWPHKLPPRIADRVYWALARKRLPQQVLQDLCRPETAEEARDAA